MIQHIIRLMFNTLRGIGHRTTEQRMTRVDTRYEDYRTGSNNASRLVSSDGKLSYLAVRVPFKSQLRFTVAFPGALSKFERNFYEGRAWAMTFEDNRPGKASPYEQGFFLPWSREAAGTQNTFGIACKMAMDLPSELSMVHADGEFLRALFRGTPMTIGVIDTTKVRSELAKTIESLKALTVAKSIRWPINLSSIIFSATCMAAIIIAFGAIMPPVEYAELGSFSSVPILLATAAVMAAVTIMYKMQFVAPLRSGILGGLAFFAVIMGLYMRVAFLLKGAPSVEIGEVISVEKQHGKYSKEISSYRVKVRVRRSLQTFEAKLSTDRYKSCTPTDVTTAQVSLYRDPFGLVFSDSIIIPCPMGIDGSSGSLDLVKR